MKLISTCGRFFFRAQRGTRSRPNQGSSPAGNGKQKKKKKGADDEDAGSSDLTDIEDET